MRPAVEDLMEHPFVTNNNLEPLDTYMGGDENDGNFVVSNEEIN